jgi:hypothetical protein
MATATPPAASTSEVRLNLFGMVLVLWLAAIGLAFVIPSCAPATRYRRGRQPMLDYCQQVLSARAAREAIAIADQHAVGVQPDPAAVSEVGERFVDGLH